MNKGIIIGIIALVVVIIVGYMLMQSASTVPGPIAPAAMPSTVTDTTGSINAELNQINIDDGDADFMDIDKDLQSL